MQIGRTILSSKLLLSPIAGYCDLAFRLSIRPLGGLGLAFTDLVNPRGILRATWKSMELVHTEPDDQPLGVQLYGHEPDYMAAAAQWCEEKIKPAVIDINMGCPVDKVCKKSGGAALLQDPPLAIKLAETVVRSVSIPVTAKMRLGWSEDAIIAPQLAAELEQVGVAAVTVHARTALQGFRGRADWQGIRRVVEAVQRIPVIGNGDVRKPQDAREMIRQTGCAGVMIGRAALGEPWLFQQTHAHLATGAVPPPPSIVERVDFMSRQLHHLVRLKGERRGCITFRQRISSFLGHLRGSAWLREHLRLLGSVQEYDAIMGEWQEYQLATTIGQSQS